MHINNLKELNLILDDNKIKRLVYDIKDSFFPKDEDLYKDSYIKNLKNIQILKDKNISDQNDNADELVEQDNENKNKDKEEELLELTNKIGNVSLSEELEIENYDDTCEEDAAEGKQNK